MQINENKKYLTLSDKNRLREWRLPPSSRRFFRFFSENYCRKYRVYQLHVIPEEVKILKSLMVRLKDILNLTDKEYIQKLLRKKKIKNLGKL